MHLNKVWCRLPREGVFVLEVRHTPATASATLPVFVSTTGFSKHRFK